MKQQDCRTLVRTGIIISSALPLIPNEVVINFVMELYSLSILAFKSSQSASKRLEVKERIKQHISDFNTVIARTYTMPTRFYVEFGAVSDIIPVKLCHPAWSAPITIPHNQ